MRVDEFDFHLPEERIALRPASPRDASRLLHIGERLTDHVFRDLPDLLRAGDVLVVNNTKVMPAALTGERAARPVGGGGPVQLDVNLHKALPPEAGAIRWRAFARPAKRLREGDEIRFGPDFAATVSAREEAEVTLAFHMDQARFDAGLQEVGHVPLPPYIGRQRPVDDQDREDYQTVYARDEGSVAAPTAGLHFTDRVFEALRDKGVAVEEVTLHVGAGTFLPVSAKDTKDHKMHAEYGVIPEDIASRLNKARAGGGRIISVGTTSLRLLESAVDEEGVIHPFADETDIFITPGYRFRAIDALITNFHLPRSTLFMLVCALGGTERLKAAYAHGIESGYRFYSYGDACLIERADD